MGADLYREGHSEHVERYDQEYERVRKKLVELIDEATEKEGEDAIMARRHAAFAASGGDTMSITAIVFADYPDIVDLSNRQNEIYNEMYSPKYYFRDSYNDSSLLNRLNLSWWADVIPLCEQDLERRKEQGNWVAVMGEYEGESYIDYYVDQDGNTVDTSLSSPWVAEQLLSMVSAPGNLDILKRITDEDERNYFVGKYDRLCHFLQSSITDQVGIFYSL